MDFRINVAAKNMVHAFCDKLDRNRWGSASDVTVGRTDVCVIPDTQVCLVSDCT